MKMYFTFIDTQRCILNNEIIIAKVAVEWNRENNKISTKMMFELNHTHEMWITPSVFGTVVHRMQKTETGWNAIDFSHFVLYR